MQDETAKVVEQLKTLLPLVRVLERLDIDLNNRDDRGDLAESLRLLRRLRENPEIEAHFALLAEMHESKKRVRQEVRGVGWHTLKQAMSVAVAAVMAAVGAFFFARHGG